MESGRLMLLESMDLNILCRHQLAHVLVGPNGPSDFFELVDTTIRVVQGTPVADVPPIHRRFSMLPRHIDSRAALVYMGFSVQSATGVWQAWTMTSYTELGDFTSYIVGLLNSSAVPQLRKPKDEVLRSLNYLCHLYQLSFNRAVAYICNPVSEEASIAFATTFYPYPPVPPTPRLPHIQLPAGPNPDLAPLSAPLPMTPAATPILPHAPMVPFTQLSAASVTTTAIAPSLVYAPHASQGQPQGPPPPLNQPFFDNTFN